MAKTNTFQRYCLKCDELFKPNGKYQKICDMCQDKARAKLTIKQKAERLKNKKVVKHKNLQKINTEVACPNCGEKIDFADIKQAIKDRIDQELDFLLESI